MAAAFRANALGNEGITGTTPNIPVTIPSGAVAGDYALVKIAVNPITASMNTVPTDWQLLDGPTSDSVSNHWVYGKPLVSGDPGTTVTWILSASARPSAHMTVISGVTATGMQISSWSVDSSLTSTTTLPTLASVPSGAAVVVLTGRVRSGTAAGNVTFTSPYSQGADERAATALGTGNNVATESAYLITTSAGSVGGESLSLAGGNSRGASLLIALPEAGAGTLDKLKLETSTVGLRVGTSTPAKVYLGTTQVWP